MRSPSPEAQRTVTPEQILMLQFIFLQMDFPYAISYRLKCVSGVVLPIRRRFP
jgi:hypothetical protein